MILRIVYDDETQVTKDVNEVGVFRQDGVLWMGLFVSDPNEQNGRKLVQDISGMDYYAVLREDRPATHWGLYGWDDEAFILHRVQSPLSPNARVILPPPIRLLHRVFIGVQVADFEGAMLRTRDRTK